MRSHEVKDEGYEVAHDGKCITVFSAPNYCDQMGNQGAYIRFEYDMKPRFHQFEVRRVTFLRNLTTAHSVLPVQLTFAK